MAEYVRFVSYLYEYQGNERKKNVGFVRYEVRSGQKRVMVSVNNVHRADGQMGVYAFYREMDSCIGIRLGVLVLRMGRGTFQYSTYADGPGEDENECRFEDIAGIMVMGGDENQCFCTVWDNERFSVNSFVRSREDLIRVRPGLTETLEIRKVEDAADEAAAAVEREEETQTEIESEYNKKDDEFLSEVPSKIGNELEAEERQTERTVEERTNTAKQKISDDVVWSDKSSQGMPIDEKAERGERPDRTYALYKQTTWDKMCKLYPKVLPFPYDAHIRALRIRPGDLGRLPRQNWALANNSFMLHGFFQYKYILILKIPAQSPEYEERFMMAVPGIFSQMDKYLAEMFGFHEFFGSPKRELDTGSFGYWVREIKMDQE